MTKRTFVKRVVAREKQKGAKILLEPSPGNFEQGRVYQKALFGFRIHYI